MARTLLLVSVVVLAGFFLFNVLFTSDRELVEADVERLVEVARRGGDDAVDEILDALADDYRGDGTFSREKIERRLRGYVGRNRMASIEIGGFQTVVTGEEIRIPLLMIRGSTKDGRIGNLLVTIAYAERDGVWKIVDIMYGRLGRQ